MKVDHEAEGWAAYAAEQERHAELRSAIAHLAEMYAPAADEPRCCPDCAAHDLSAELLRVMSDA